MQYDEDVSPARKFFHSKYTRAVLIMDVIVILIVVGVVIFNSTKTATIDILTVPSIAKVKIDNGEYSSGTYRIHPGNHTAEISAEGFQPKNISITAESGAISKIYVYLVPEDGTFEWYTLKENYDDFEQLTAIASNGNNTTTDQDTSAEEFINIFQKNYQIYQESLPISKSEYGVGPNGDTYKTKDILIEKNKKDYCRLYICMKAIIIGGEKEDADQLILEKGFNIENIEVFYDVSN
ncbi:hypothetical protein IJG04_02450 [Candidatus Saccharibacteria bacterium]|nr:hypothetical protein [Candidatus Saccharibacteria bacterium]